MGRSLGMHTSMQAFLKGSVSRYWHQFGVQVIVKAMNKVSLVIIGPQARRIE